MYRHSQNAEASYFSAVVQSPQSSVLPGTAPNQTPIVNPDAFIGPHNKAVDSLDADIWDRLADN